MERALDQPEAAGPGPRFVPSTARCLFPGPLGHLTFCDRFNSDHLEHEVTVTQDNYSFPLSELEPKATATKREAASLEHPNRSRT